MKFDWLETKRKQYLPWYIVFNLLTFLAILAAVIVLIILSLGFDFLEYVAVSLLAVVVIFSLIYIGLKIENKFIKETKNEFDNQMILPLLKESINAKLDSNLLEEDIIDQSDLIKNSHIYEILYNFNRNDVQVVEFKLKGFNRLEGLFFKIKLEDNDDDLIFVNHKYYFKTTFSNYYMVKSGFEQFDQRFKSYNKNHPTMPLNNEILGRILTDTIYYKITGLQIKDGYMYVLASIKQPIFRLDITSKVDEGYYYKLKRDFNRILRIINIKEVLNNKSTENAL